MTRPEASEAQDSTSTYTYDPSCTHCRNGTPHHPAPPAERAETTGLPTVDAFEAAIQSAYDQHDDHRTRHPGHRGECQDDWPSAWRLAPLVRAALAAAGADREGLASVRQQVADLPRLDPAYSSHYHAGYAAARTQVLDLIDAALATEAPTEQSG